MCKVSYHEKNSINVILKYFPQMPKKLCSLFSNQRKSLVNQEVPGTSLRPIILFPFPCFLLKRQFHNQKQQRLMTFPTYTCMVCQLNMTWVPNFSRTQLIGYKINQIYLYEKLCLINGIFVCMNLNSARLDTLLIQNIVYLICVKKATLRSFYSCYACMVWSLISHMKRRFLKRRKTNATWLLTP